MVKYCWQYSLGCATEYFFVKTSRNTGPIRQMSMSRWTRYVFGSKDSVENVSDADFCTRPIAQKINNPTPVFPLRKLYTEQMFVVLCTKRMQLRNHVDTNTEELPSLKGLCEVYTQRIKFRMLTVRENETALRKLSGGTAQLRTLEGELPYMFLLISSCVHSRQVLVSRNEIIKLFCELFLAVFVTDTSSVFHVFCVSLPSYVCNAYVYKTFVYNVLLLSCLWLDKMDFIASYYFIQTTAFRWFVVVQCIREKG